MKLSDIYIVIWFQAINVCVPFIFKYAVDYLGDSSNFLDLSNAPTAVVTVATGSMLLCMSFGLIISSLFIKIFYLNKAKSWEKRNKIDANY